MLYINFKIKFSFLKRTQKEWQLVFWSNLNFLIKQIFDNNIFRYFFFFSVCAIVYIVGGILDLILLNADIQPWAKIEERNVNNDEKENNTSTVKF